MRNRKYHVTIFLESNVSRSLRPTAHSLHKQVYDGDSTNDPLLGMFCGDEIPGSVVSSGNKLLVKFTSDSSVRDTGFEGSFIFSNFFEGKNGPA